MEVRGEGLSMLNRKCVVVRWVGLTLDWFLNLVHKGAGAILILIPQDWKTREVEALGKEMEQVVKGKAVNEKIRRRMRVKRRRGRRKLILRTMVRRKRVLILSM